MPNDIITLMVVETPDSMILAEAPPIRDAETGMTAMVGQIRGVISWLALTHRGSAVYELGRTLMGEPRHASGVFMPWDAPKAKEKAPMSGNIDANSRKEQYDHDYYTE